MTDPWKRRDDWEDDPDRRKSKTRKKGAGDIFRDLIPAFLTVAAIVGALALTAWLIGEAFGLFDSVEDGLYAAFMAALLVFLCSGPIAGLRANIGGAIKSILAWVAIGLVAIAGYAFRDELTHVWERIAAELSPGAAVHGDRSLMVRASSNGSFYMDVFLNGRRARMLVDTGASGLALSPADMRMAGLDPSRMTYNVPVQTADGAALAARTVIGSVQVGGLTFRNYPVLVLRRGRVSLLGVDLLRRFRSFEINGDRLTLRW